MKALTCIAAVLLLLIAAPAGLAGSGADQIRNAIMDWEAAYNSGDSAELARLYTENGVLLPPGAARVEGTTNIAEFWQGTMDAGLADVDLEATEIEILGNTATDIGRFTATMPDATGAAVPVTGKYIVIYKRNSDGRWHLYRDIWNMDQ